MSLRQFRNLPKNRCLSSTVLKANPYRVVYNFQGIDKRITNT